MSSALAMVLMAAMAIPGNGPEKVSGEVEQGLDLSGKWEAICYRPGGGVLRGQASISEEGGLSISGQQGPARRGGQGRFHIAFGKVIDEGSGHIRSQNSLGIGIYKQEGDRLLICFGYDKHRPTSFRAGDGQFLLILRRVKPGK